MTNERDPWYVCSNPGCTFETNSGRNASNHEHEMERVEGWDE